MYISNQQPEAFELRQQIELNSLDTHIFGAKFIQDTFGLDVCEDGNEDKGFKCRLVIISSLLVEVLFLFSLSFLK